MDKVDVELCWVAQVPLLKYVPKVYEERYAAVRRQAYRRVIEAEAAVAAGVPAAEEVLTRALKLLGVLNQLLLRRPVKGGRRGRHMVARRFAQIQNGDYGALVKHWLTDVALAVAAAPKRRRNRCEEAATRRAVELIQRGRVSRAVQELTSKGTRDLADEDIREQLRAKTPQTRLDWDPERDVPHAEAMEVALRDVWAKLDPESAPGPDGMPTTYLAMLARREFDDPQSAGVVAAAEDFARLVLNDRMPWWFYRYWTATVHVAVVKSVSEAPGQADDCRPVMVGNVERRAQARAAGEQHGDAIREYCEEAGQLGAGTKAGGQLLVRGTGIAMEARPGHVYAKMDEENGYNLCHRQAMIDVLAGEESLGVWYNFFNSHLAPAAPIFYRDGNGRMVELPYCSVDGGQQGSFEGGAGYSLASVPAARKLRRVLRAGGGDFTMGADDSVGHAPADVLWPALEQYREEKSRTTGAVFNAAKCRCFSPGGQYGERPTAFQIEGEEEGGGLEVWGCATGSDGFVTAYVERKGERCRSLISTITRRLATVDPDCLMQVVRLSLSHVLDWVVQNHPPRLTMAEARRFDGAIAAAVAAAGGVDVLDPLAAYSSQVGLQATDLVARRARQPIRLGGLGIRSVEDVARPAYVGVMNMTLPFFLDWQGGDGAVVPGFYNTPMMSEVLGDGSFDVGGEDQRLAVFLQSGLPMAADVEEAWQVLQGEVGLDDHGPLSAPVAGMGGGEYAEKLQRSVTKQREETRAVEIEAVALQLPPGDERKVSFCNWSPTAGSLFGSCPTPDTASPPELYCLAFSAFFGVEVPALRPLVGRRIGKGARAKVVDRCGFNLALDGGVCKSAWKRGHDALLLTVVEDLRRMGLRARTEARDVFASAIPPEAAEAMDRDPEANVAGLVPDGVVEGFSADSGLAVVGPQLVELKTIHESTSAGWWSVSGAPGRPLRPAVEVRAAAVHGEYQRRATKADQRYCGTQQGDTGPIRKRLDELPKVMPLVFGSLGQVSESVTRLAKAAALEGARRRACRANFNVKGGDVREAAALMSWYMLRRWGRLAVLRSLLVKEAALRVVPGSAQHFAQAANGGEGGGGGGSGPAAEFWAKRGSREDGGPSFGGFGAGLGCHA